MKGGGVRRALTPVLPHTQAHGGVTEVSLKDQRGPKTGWEVRFWRKIQSWSAPHPTAHRGQYWLQNLTSVDHQAVLVLSEPSLQASTDLCSGFVLI